MDTREAFELIAKWKESDIANPTLIAEAWGIARDALREKVVREPPPAPKPDFARAMRFVDSRHHEIGSWNPETKEFDEASNLLAVMKAVKEEVVPWVRIIANAHTSVAHVSRENAINLLLALGVKP